MPFREFPQRTGPFMVLGQSSVYVFRLLCICTEHMWGLACILIGGRKPRITHAQQRSPTHRHKLSPHIHNFPSVTCSSVSDFAQGGLALRMQFAPQRLPRRRPLMHIFSRKGDAEVADSPKSQRAQVTEVRQALLLLAVTIL